MHSELSLIPEIQVSDNLNFHRILNTARFLFGRYPPTLLKELKKEYLQICERQRRQRSAIQNLELTKVSHKQLCHGFIIYILDKKCQGTFT